MNVKDLKILIETLDDNTPVLALDDMGLNLKEAKADINTVMQNLITNEFELPEPTTPKGYELGFALVIGK